jgi:hypothetical protein
MDVTYREAAPEDVPAMTDLFFASVSDMYTRHGLPVTVRPRDSVLLGYEHVRSTGIFHLAEVDGEIGCIAGAIVRDRIWFLSAFWVRPGLQRQRLGMPVLRRVVEAGKQAGADTFFVWSSIDRTAMAAYMKLGMLPGFQILVFEGTPREIPPAPAGCETAPLDSSVAEDIDLIVRGTRRPVEHRFWSGPAGLRGRQVLRHGRLAGYFYHAPGGVIGPAGWTDPGDAGAVLALACREAAEASSFIRLSIPGINHAALRFALDAGMRFEVLGHLLASAPVGRMEQYLASGALLF